MNDVEKNNRMIAEFDGWKYVPTSENQFTNEHYERGQDWCSVNDFTYHQDWNALMPVVEKIEAMGYIVSMSKGNCYIRKDKIETPVVFIARETRATKREATYAAVTSFINNL